MSPEGSAGRSGSGHSRCRRALQRPHPAGGAAASPSAGKGLSPGPRPSPCEGVSGHSAADQPRSGGGCGAASPSLTVRGAIFRPLSPLIPAVPFPAGLSRRQDPPGRGAPEHQQPQPVRTARSETEPERPGLPAGPAAPQRQPARGPSRQGPGGRHAVGNHPGPRQRVGESTASPGAFAEHPRNGGQEGAWCCVP